MFDFRMRIDMGLLASALVGLAACGSTPPPAETTSPPVAAVVTGPQSASWYQDCWNLFNTKAWDAFKRCYADDVVSEQVDGGGPAVRGVEATVAAKQPLTAAFPDLKGDGQLILVNDRTVASLFLMTGTQSGPLAGPSGPTIPPTNKRVGYYMGHVIEIGGNNTVTREWLYADMNTLMAQLGVSRTPARPVVERAAAEPTIAVATGAGIESQNVAAMRAQYDMFSKHDIKGVESFNQPDAVFHDLTQPVDMDGKANTAMLEGFFTGFPDARITLERIWGAADYVVAQGRFTGTNTKPSPGLGLKQATNKAVTVNFLEITHVTDGKVKENWLLFDSMAFGRQLGLAP